MALGLPFRSRVIVRDAIYAQRLRFERKDRFHGNAGRRKRQNRATGWTARAVIVLLSVRRSVETLHVTDKFAGSGDDAEISI